MLAPYKENGRPKDWTESRDGNFRDTHPSNIWTDITVPFWSMPENTDHPTQKPEKLLAKIILASTNEGDTSSIHLRERHAAVVARKLGGISRHRIDEGIASSPPNALSSPKPTHPFKAHRGIF